MRCEHINQQNNWAICPPTINRSNRGSALAPPFGGMMEWHDVLGNAPIGPPILKRVFIGCRSNGLPYEFGCWSEQKAWESETGLKYGLPKQSSCDTS